jgi:cobyrinic acid a,c-diamide synthase
MVNFLPLATSMENPKLHLGYRCITSDGLEIRGHEFHYSTCKELENTAVLPCRITNARGLAVPARIYQKQQTTASYLHLYWGEQKGFIQKLMDGSFAPVS